MRQAFRVLLDADPEIEIVGEAIDGLESVALVEQLRPEVLLVDLMMPGLSGLEVTRQVSQRFPETRVLVLSMHSDEEYVREALGNGAAGYVLKNSSASELVQGVKQVAIGKRYLCSKLAERAIDFYVQSSEDKPQEPYDRLSTREREVLHLLAEAYNQPSIGRRLSISPRTVETHRINLMRKLGLRTQTDLVRFAIRRGLLPLE